MTRVLFLVAGFTLSLAATFSLVATLGFAQSPPSGKSPATPPPKWTIQDVEQKLADYWIEVDIKTAGKKLDEFEHFGFSFVQDAEKKSPLCWLRRGEAVLSECGGIGVEKVLDDGTIHIKINAFPGIMKWNQDHWIVVTPREGGTHAWSSSYNRLTREQILAMTRPKEFTSTATNGNTVRILKRTTGLYGTEPVATPRGKTSPN